MWTKLPKNVWNTKLFFKNKLFLLEEEYLGTYAYKDHFIFLIYD